jgi:CRISPR-associated Cas5-like protein
MFGLRITLRPTALLTFRRVPFSTLEMLTYPFVPPTTLSGYLARVLRLAHGEALPDVHHIGAPAFYALPQDFHVLGALASPSPTIISTTRHGVRDLGHTAFSRLHQASRKTNAEHYQLYRWEYLCSDQFAGYILHEDEEPLTRLTSIHGYGCKLGKEGWAYVEQVEGPFPLEKFHTQAVPSTILPATDAFGGGCQMYPLYRYAWSEDSQDVYLSDGGPSPIVGFLPFLAALSSLPLALDYYQWNDVFISASLLNYF